MKKALCILLVLLALLGVGCGDKSAPVETDLAGLYRSKAQEFIDAGNLDSAIAALREGVSRTGDVALSDMLDALEENRRTIQQEAQAAEETAEPEAAEPEEPPPTETSPPVSNDTFVLVQDYIPDIVVELKYAAEDNFTGAGIYSFQDAYLRYGTVKKLAEAQAQLRESGRGLKIWDAFRPVQAQWALWNACPDANFVVNPENGYSSHSRGNTVDVTMVEGGMELPMPTGFDDFSPLADRDYSDCPPEEAANALELETLMSACGFRPYFGEWWHFTDVDDYEVEMEFLSPG